MNGRRELLVGMFTLAVLVVLGYYSIAVADLWLNTRYIRVHFGRVHGLQEGNAVRVYGLDVGKVRGFELRPDGVTALLEVDQQVSLHSGYEITVAHFSPLGGRVVAIDPGDTTQPEVNYESVLEGETIPDVLEQVSLLTDRNSDNITVIIENLKKVSEQLTRTDSTAGLFLNDSGLYLKADELLGTLREAANEFSDILHGKGPAGQFFRDEQVFDDLRASVTDLRATVEELRETSERLNRGEGTVGMLMSDADTARVVSETMANVREATAKVNEGDGVLARVLNDTELADDVSAAVRNAREITDKINDGEGPLGVLIADRETGDRMRRAVEHVEEIARGVRGGDGTVGLLLRDEETREQVQDIVAEVRRVVVELRESVEDTREQAPVNAFVGSIFAAF